MAKINEYNDSPKSFDGSSITWFAIYAAIGLIVSLAIPFPLSLLFCFGIVMLLQAHRIEFSKQGFHSTTNTIITPTMPMPRNPDSKTSKWPFRRLFNSFYTRLFDDPYGYVGYRPLRLYCMKCGKEHRRRSCPSCGSMAVRMV